MIDKIADKISATIIDNQIPFRPKKIGKMITHETWKISVLEIAIMEETKPLFKAVNIDEP